MNHLGRLKSWTKAKIKRLTATTSKTAIAALSAVILILVVSISLFKSVRFFCWSHPGIVIVVIAVAGEVICDWNRKKSLKERLKKFFGMLLVGGLLLEVAEAVKSDKKVSDAQVEVQQLQLQVEQTSNSVVVANANFLRSRTHLQIQLNQTKTELANAEARLIELRNENSPIDIGDQNALGDALSSIAGIGVELRYSTDANAQDTANSLASLPK